MLRKECEKCVNDLYKHTCIHIKSTHGSVFVFVYVCVCYVYIYIYNTHIHTLYKYIYYNKRYDCAVKTSFSSVYQVKVNLQNIRFSFDYFICNILYSSRHLEIRMTCVSINNNIKKNVLLFISSFFNLVLLNNFIYDK